LNSLFFFSSVSPQPTTNIEPANQVRENWILRSAFAVVDANA
jgi:hypothetical protein